MSNLKKIKINNAHQTTLTLNRSVLDPISCHLHFLYHIQWSSKIQKDLFHA